MREFIEGVHFRKEDKRDDNLPYLLYLKNKHQSKAFPLGIISGCLAVKTFLNVVKNNPSFNKFSKSIYSINLFICIHTFIYEMWSKMYTDKEIVSRLDAKILLS